MDMSRETLKAGLRSKEAMDVYDQQRSAIVAGALNWTERSCR
jgi:hypothetical protein